MNRLKLLWDLYCLNKNTKKTRIEMLTMQELQLRELLRHAYTKSTFYYKAFSDAGITEENIDTLPLSAFPTIDKPTLIKHFDELVTVSDLTQEELRQYDEQTELSRKPYKGKYHLVHSSGSTGKPSYFVYDRSAWNTVLLGIIRASFWNMSMPQILRFLAHGTRIAYVAATDGRYGGAMATGDGVDGVGAKEIHLDINMPLDEWVTQLRKFKPNVISGYPSAIKIIGELVERGEISLNILRIISCGEPLGASLRHYLEKIFQAEVINFYGSSESLAMGVESNSEEDMLLFDDLNVIEVAQDGIYLTSLYNYSQPLIRYWLSDNLTLCDPGHNSRYPYTKAIGLLGRNEDLLWFEDGNGHREFLHPLAIEGFCIEGLKDYQFCKLSNDTFEMIAEICKNASEDAIRQEMLNQMKTILDDKQLGYVQFYVRFTDEILPDPKTGKKRLVVTVAEEGEVFK